jgi:hypothetical protein
MSQKGVEKKKAYINLQFLFPKTVSWSGRVRMLVDRVPLTHPISPSLSV